MNSLNMVLLFQMQCHSHPRWIPVDGQALDHGSYEGTRPWLSHALGQSACFVSSDKQRTFVFFNSTFITCCLLLPILHREADRMKIRQGHDHNQKHCV